MLDRVKILSPILDASVQADEKEWPAFDGSMLDRSQYVSSSEIGKCARQVWFSKNIPINEGNFYWGYAERGHSHEAWTIKRILSYKHGYTWYYVGDEQVSFYDAYQSGTPDGLFVDAASNFLFEHKSIDPRTKISALPKKEHIDQCIQNMDLLEICLDISISGGLIVYGDASDYSKIQEFMIDRHNSQVMERMIALENRAEAIMKATSAEQLEPEGLYNGGCKTCSFKAQCSASITQAKQEKDRYEQAGKAASRFFG